MRNRVGGRVVDRLGSNLTKVAAVTQFILPGLPAMFAGDEIGASYEPYSELTTVPWRQIRAQTVLRALFGCPPRRSRNGVVAYGWIPKPLAVDLVEARLFTGL